VKKEDVLLLAIPYPAGTSFQIWYQAASWCGTSWAVCRHNYTAGYSPTLPRRITKKFCNYTLLALSHVLLLFAVYRHLLPSFPKDQPIKKEIFGMKEKDKERKKKKKRKEIN
jgi:hypothetical protein